eukprot:PhF_6_TR2322/c0_g1_i2/m.4125
MKSSSPALTTTPLVPIEIDKTILASRIQRMSKFLRRPNSGNSSRTTDAAMASYQHQPIHLRPHSALSVRSDSRGGGGNSSTSSRGDGYHNNVTFGRSALLQATPPPCWEGVRELFYQPTSPAEALSTIEWLAAVCDAPPLIATLLSIRNILAKSLFPESDVLLKNHTLSFSDYAEGWIHQRSQDFWSSHVPVQEILSQCSDRMAMLQRAEGYAIKKLLMKRRTLPIVDYHNHQISRLYFKCWRKMVKETKENDRRSAEFLKEKSENALRKCWLGWRLETARSFRQRSRTLEEVLRKQLQDERTKVGCMTANTNRTLYSYRELQTKLNNANETYADTLQRLAVIEKDPFVIDFSHPIYDVNGKEIMNGCVSFMNITHGEIPPNVYMTHPTNPHCTHAIVVWDASCDERPPSNYVNTGSTTTTTTSNTTSSFTTKSCDGVLQQWIQECTERACLNKGRLSRRTSPVQSHIHAPTSVLDRYHRRDENYRQRVQQMQKEKLGKN